ncbi:DUF421 domain-containing protein [Neobacillus sp. DY30]|uniref:DUF421 domain-containing protein n=1 Tax=Neobacillus sp. DY30 TaxID=3047871 RepID=UPI0024BFAB67|nr:DUF421 domain-containing protein [Neobacillus sp. DY30]WHX98114.1 DUF421 domain-containing protein [Neobacillus sp. DY30]
MHFIKDTLIVYGRIVTILPLLLFFTLYMGKRSIGELPVFDFLIIITLGAVVGADIADPAIEHIHTATAIVGLALLQKLISTITLRSRRIGKALTFEPTIVIMDGVLMVKNLRKIQYSLDNILQMLREKDVFDISVVKLGIIEANGKISVYKKPNKSQVIREDVGIDTTTETMPYPVIIEGKIDHNTLSELGTNESWLMEQLQMKGIKKVDDIFFASLTSDLKLHLSPVNKDAPKYINH